MKILILSVLLLPLVVMAQTKTELKAAPLKTKNVLVSKQSIERGKTIYQTYCLACHQADGSGVGTLNPPIVKEWAGGDKTKIIRMILKGSVGKVEIDGDVFSNTMPAQPAFTDQQIADVLTYVRTNFGFKASAVTPVEVKAVRAKTK